MRVNLFHSRAPNELRVPVTINITQSDLVHTNDGEVVFILVFAVNVLDKDGKRIDDVVIENVTGNNVKKEIANGLSILASKIDWENLQQDVHPPRVKDVSPYNKQVNVPISDDIFIKLRDEFPAAGIDTSTIKLFANDVEVTPELSIRQRDNEVSIKWIPRKITN
jgi:hypothetical protein